MRSIFFLLLLLGSLTQAKVYIGIDADISAVAKEGGIAIVRGAQIAIDQINENGGLLGQELELVVKDHRGNPARGVANIKKFAQMENLLAVIGGVHTPVALAELETIHKYNLIYLDPWAAGTTIVDNGYRPNYAFRVSVRDQEAGKVLLKHAKSQGYQKIGLLLERTGWGRSNEASMTKAAQEEGIDVSVIEWFNWGEQDLTTQVTALKNHGVEAILLVANAPEGAIAAKAVYQVKKSLPIISHWGIAGGNFVELLGLDILNELNISVLQTFHFAQSADNEIAAKLLATYQSAYDNSATALSIKGAVGVAHAYDLVNLLAIAVKQAESFEREQVQKQLELINRHQGAVKLYQPPFTKDQHDALLAEDYILTKFNSVGQLIPMD